MRNSESSSKNMQLIFLLFLLLTALAQISLALESNAFRFPQKFNETHICDSRSSKCEVLLDVPENCVDDDMTSTCPILFFLHDESVNPEHFRLTSAIHQQNMIGIYPKSDCIGWNTKDLPCNQCSYDEFDCETDANDPQFIADIIAALRSRGAIGNIYARGTSNGAALAHKLAVNAGPNLPIAGIITNSMQLLKRPARSGPGRFNFNQPIPGNPPVSILSLHGTDDRLIPYYGGDSEYFGSSTSYSLMAISESNLAWATHNGCNLTPIKTPLPSTQGSLANLVEYKNCTDGVTVKHYEIVNGGHFVATARVNGTSFNDLIYKFIRDLEGIEETAKMPDITPSPTPGLVCENDESWFFWNSSYDCEFVAKNPNTRCILPGRDGRPAKVACPVVCDDRCVSTFISSLGWKDLLLMFSRIMVTRFVGVLNKLLGNMRTLPPALFDDIR